MSKLEKNFKISKYRLIISCLTMFQKTALKPLHEGKPTTGVFLVTLREVF